MSVDNNEFSDRDDVTAGRKKTASTASKKNIKIKTENKKSHKDTKKINHDNKKLREQSRKIGQNDNNFNNVNNDNSGELLCPPDKARRSAKAVILGTLLRALIIVFLTVSMVLFISTSFRIEVSVSNTFLYAALFTAIFTVMLTIRKWGLLSGLTALAATAVFSALNLQLLLSGILTFYNSMLDRLISARYYAMENWKADILFYLPYDKDYLINAAVFVLCLFFAAIFTLSFIRRITLPKMIFPCFIITVILVIIFTYNIARSNWSSALLISSLCGVLVLVSYDRTFSRQTEKQKKDSEELLFAEDDRPQLPDEVVKKIEARDAKKQARLERKNDVKAAKKERRNLKKRINNRKATVDEEISSYFRTSPRSVKIKKDRKSKNNKDNNASTQESFKSGIDLNIKMTPEEKKAFLSEVKAQKKQQKREKNAHRRKIKKEVDAVKRYDYRISGSRNAAGGFAAFGVFVLTMLILVIPAASIDKRFSTFPALEEKLNEYREYITALLRGDDPVLDLLDYQNNASNFEPRSTDATPRYYTGEKIFDVNTQYRAGIYMRGWIGVDYADGFWYAVDEETVDEYRALFGTTYDPKEMMFKNFYNISLPGSMDATDFVTKYKTYQKYGFVTAQVNLARAETDSMYVYMPSYYDTDIGLLNYGTNEASELTYVNFFDGIYVGRKFEEETSYATVSYLATMKNESWYIEVANLIAEYNKNKYNIEQYNSDSSYAPWENLDIVFDPDNGNATITYLNDDGEYVMLLCDSSGNIISSSAYYTETQLDLFIKYREYMTQYEKNDLLYCYRVDNLYTDFVYNTYLDYAQSDIVTNVLDQIIKFIPIGNSDADDKTLNTDLASVRSSQNANTYIQRHTLTMAIIDWLCDNCEYTLVPTKAPDESLTGVENFLSVQKQGYCVQYASSVALMLRECGIPARYVEGYICSDLSYNQIYLNSDYRYTGTVRDYNAHAWVEVWYDGLGWIQYECTPEYYDTMYNDASSDIPIVDPDPPSQNPEPLPYEFETELLADIESLLSLHKSVVSKLSAEFEAYPFSIAEEEISSLTYISGTLDTYTERYDILSKTLHDAVVQGIPESEFDSASFISDGNFLYNEIYNVGETLETLEAKSLDIAEFLKKLAIVITVALLCLAVITGIVIVLVYAARATRKHISEIEKLINADIAKGERQKTAYMLIDRTSYLLNIYGSAPKTGEFRDEYAKRISFEYETVFGHPTEYDYETDENEQVAAMEQSRKLEADKAKDDPNLAVSNFNIGEIFDSVAAEEFGGHMEVDQIKTLAKFYLKLYQSSKTRLSPIRWLRFHCVKHTV